ncbi:calcium-binding protein [Nocardioides sp. C4-1]|uniref:calcium-binding protein n=1 Tax=Nocardioides sp. C4-1 TaxID=3151851 RepID=UPI00326570E3
MLIRSLAGAAALVLTATLASVVPAVDPIAAAEPASAPVGRAANHPVTEIVGQFDGGLPRLRARQVHLSTSRWGYRFIGGRIGQRLTITEVGGRLHFVDRAARSWKKIPPTCRRMRVPGAAAVSCAILGGDRPYLEIWPRLGHDSVDGHTLPARHRMWVLGDAGNETVRLGAGADFTNGAMGSDRISGGAGNDWIRSAKGRNVVDGGPGNDRIAGGDQSERLAGGTGNDRIYGAGGNDALRGDAGRDVLSCGGGRDTAVRDAADRLSRCEVVRR